MVFILLVFLFQVFFHNLYCFVFISVYVMLLLAVLVTIGPSAFNKFGLVWFGNNPRKVGRINKIESSSSDSTIMHKRCYRKSYLKIEN